MTKCIIIHFYLIFLQVVIDFIKHNSILNLVYIFKTYNHGCKKLNV